MIKTNKMNLKWKQSVTLSVTSEAMNKARFFSPCIIVLLLCYYNIHQNSYEYV